MVKLIKRIVIFVICLVAIISIGVIGGYVFVRVNYNIDLFNTINELRILTQKVNENEICPNAFNDEDYKTLKSKMDEEFLGLILNKEESNEYYIDFSALESLESLAKNDITMSEKEAGALLQIVFNKQAGGKLKTADKEISASIVQVDFSNISENNADFNVVVKLGLSQFKEEMKTFPLDFIKKYIPDYLYVSSIVKVTKTNEEMNYNVSHVALKLNALSDKETDDLFDTIDKIFKIGNIEDFNMKIGETMVNALIGNKNNKGFAYSLKAIGKTRFDFKMIDNIDCFVIS